MLVTLIRFVVMVVTACGMAEAIRHRARAIRILPCILWRCKWVFRCKPITLAVCIGAHCSPLWQRDEMRSSDALPPFTERREREQGRWIGG